MDSNEPDRPEVAPAAPERKPQPPLLRKDWLARHPRFQSIAGGVGVVLGFPPFDVVPLLFLGMILVLRSLRDVPPRRGFSIGLVFGLTVQAGGFYWISGAVARFYRIFLTGGEGGGGAALLLALGAFVVWWAVTSLAWGLWGAALGASPRHPGLRVAWIVLAVMAVEAWYPRIFPWNLGSGVQGSIWLCQSAWWLGVGGTSAAVVCVAALWNEGGRGAPRGGRRWRAAAAAVLVAWLAGGAVRVASDRIPESTVLRIGYVQASISLERRHSHDLQVAQGVLSEIEERTRELARAEAPDVIVWAEGMIPTVTPAEAVGAWVRNRVRAPLVIGGLSTRGDQAVNRAFLVLDPARGAVEVYDKRFLVPFGEQYPARGFLRSIGIDIPADDLGAGGEPTVVELRGVPLSPSICFEGILPGTAHELREAGARLHLNLTEDLWYGRSSAPHQHLALTRMRGIEGGLPLVRITNGGISAAIDRKGRVIESVPLGGPVAGVFEVPIPDRLPEPPFTQFIFRYLSWALLPFAGLVWAEHRRKRASSPS